MYMKSVASGYVQVNDDFSNLSDDKKETNEVSDSAIVSACKTGDLRKLKMIVGRGAMVNFNYRNAESSCSIGCHTPETISPLYSAAHNGHQSIVEYLIVSCDAQVNFKSSDNATALYAASVHGHDSIVEYLLNSGADLTIACSTDNYMITVTPLEAAKHNNHTSTIKKLECRLGIKNTS